MGGNVALSVDRYHSFVVRILSREGDVIHGQITHIGTHETVRFRDAQRMVDFVLEHLSLPVDQPAVPSGRLQEEDP
jgi:hypothetical protein